MEAKLRAGYQRRGIKPDRAHVNRDFMTAVAPHGTTAWQAFTLGKSGRMRKNYAVRVSS
ncbi:MULTISPECIES: hypothetical protein [Rhizobium]|jgi:hypothetical protein|uniref:hypothetical protein n=1 Tax=Rhizobium TaxID=379 RepID=UPI000A67AF12|nr:MULTISPECIES: hypothetical protein [Rhizobium]MBB3298382.1 hypothetical protein [Rhizobium sp. BK112]MBB3367710.1 hypothetical protein [Rhizobium sp. BK077]MBB3742510.1 hypothetical protein [Rhizobium sp. BK591]MBB4117330.1 hypothetical protein [Rhizobium sp. BK226]MBB4178274.1 hypothetical protein [Rhizobium sp. BK109]